MLMKIDDIEDNLISLWSHSKTAQFEKRLR